MTPTLEELLERVAELVTIAYDDGQDLTMDAGLAATLRAHLAPAQPALFHANTLGYAILVDDNATPDLVLAYGQDAGYPDTAINVYPTADSAQEALATDFGTDIVTALTGTPRVVALVPLTEFDG